MNVNINWKKVSHRIKGLQVSVVTGEEDFLNPLFSRR